MTPQSVAAIFAVCLIGGLVGTAVLLSVPTTRGRLVDVAPQFAAVVAIGAMAGSLYFSERAGFIPCELCWFQRIAMYPMAVILPLGIIRRDQHVMRYSLALSTVGLMISGYHMWIQWFPASSNFCEFDNPCSAKWVEAFDVFTIPQMAGMAFLLIIVLSVAVISRQRSLARPDAD